MTRKKPASFKQNEKKTVAPGNGLEKKGEAEA